MKILACNKPERHLFRGKLKISSTVKSKQRTSYKNRYYNTFCTVCQADIAEIRGSLLCKLRDIACINMIAKAKSRNASRVYNVSCLLSYCSLPFSSFTLPCNATVTQCKSVYACR